MPSKRLVFSKSAVSAGLCFSGKLVADKIYIISAKYGLVLEDKIIEPYNETLKDKSAKNGKHGEIWCLANYKSF